MNDPNSSELDYTACDDCKNQRLCPCGDWWFCMADDEFYDEDEGDCPSFEGR
ncbi:MAG: hypothetical protein RR547_02800 [Raoultibacter sp.]